MKNYLMEMVGLVALLLIVGLIAWHSQGTPVCAADGPKTQVSQTAPVSENIPTAPTTDDSAKPVAGQPDNSAKPAPEQKPAGEEASKPLAPPVVNSDNVKPVVDEVKPAAVTDKPQDSKPAEGAQPKPEIGADANSGDGQSAASPEQADGVTQATPAAAKPEASTQPQPEADAQPKPEADTQPKP